MGRRIAIERDLAGPDRGGSYRNKSGPPHDPLLPVELDYDTIRPKRVMRLRILTLAEGAAG